MNRPSDVFKFMFFWIFFDDLNYVKGIYIFMYYVPIYVTYEITSFTKLLYIKCHSQAKICSLKQFASNDEDFCMYHKVKS